MRNVLDHCVCVSLSNSLSLKYSPLLLLLPPPPLFRHPPSSKNKKIVHTCICEGIRKSPPRRTRKSPLGDACDQCSHLGHGDSREVQVVVVLDAWGLWIQIRLIKRHHPRRMTTKKSIEVQTESVFYTGGTGVRSNHAHFYYESVKRKLNRRLI